MYKSDQKNTKFKVCVSDLTAFKITLKKYFKYKTLTKEAGSILVQMISFTNIQNNKQQ